VTAAKASGYRVQITFESLDDALDAARRLRVRAVAG
jgi:predicted ABC-type ATPase